MASEIARVRVCLEVEDSKGEVVEIEHRGGEGATELKIRMCARNVEGRS